MPAQLIQQALRWATPQQALGYVAEAKALKEHPVWALEAGPEQRKP